MGPIKLSSHERASVERRIKSLQEQLEKLLDSQVPRQALVDQWRKVLDELSDLNEKLV